MSQQRLILSEEDTAFETWGNVEYFCLTLCSPHTTTLPILFLSAQTNQANDKMKTKLREYYIKQQRTGVYMYSGDGKHRTEEQDFTSLNVSTASKRDLKKTALLRC